jgi:hypothetical protein
MNRADRRRNGIDRMQPVLVDDEGQIWPVNSPFFWTRPRQPDGNIVDYAVSKLGFIHIWSVDGSSIVVALRPDLVHPKTMAAAFYAIADLQPIRVFISATNTAKQQWELFTTVNRALNRIERLVTAARNSSIGTQLLRVWGNLRVTDNARHGHAPRAWYFRDFTRRGGDRKWWARRCQARGRGPRDAAARQPCWRAALPHLS